VTDDTIPNFDDQQFASAVRSSFLTTKRAWSHLKPDICRGVMTEDLWAQQKSRMEAVQLDGARNIVEGLIISQLDLTGRRSLGLEDEVRVRLTVAGTDYIVSTNGAVITGSRQPDQWVEEWVMTRSRDPGLLAAAANPKCPNCGAPLSIDADGHCGYCQAAVPGAKTDWLASYIDRPAVVDTTGESTVHGSTVGILSGVRDDDSARAALLGESAPVAPLADAAATAGIAAIQAHDPDFSVGDILAEAREIFLGLEQGRSRMDPSPVRPYVSDLLWRAEVARAEAARASTRNTVRAFLDIKSITVARANSDANGDSLSLRVSADSADHVIDVNTDQLISGTNELFPWSENLILVRGPGLKSDPLRGIEAHQCPHCGAPAEVGEDGACASCGEHVTGGEFDWILWQIEGPTAGGVP
jgi:predicted lipid-binding transport protein (Tim44 family)